MLVLRVVDGADGLEQTFDTVGFVKDGELGSDLRQFVDGVLAIELKDPLAIGKPGFAAVFEEQVDAVVAAKAVNHQTNTGDYINYEHCVEKNSTHSIKNLCIIECLAPNIETLERLCYVFCVKMCEI